MKGQPALDFMLSYGFALIVIIVAVAIIISISFGNPTYEVQSCYVQPGFSCQFLSLNSSGNLTIQLVQTTGGYFVINGAACSSTINASGDSPAYGNIYVSNSLLFYTQNGLPKGNIFSDEAFTLGLKCYDSKGVASGAVGNGFAGYVFLNYTVPGYGKVVREIAAFNAKYT
ncbi:MAG: hypothetical protein QXL16_01990 [Candidatus Micrarchaeaceae archaeon]